MALPRVHVRLHGKAVDEPFRPAVKGHRKAKLAFVLPPRGRTGPPSPSQPTAPADAHRIHPDADDPPFPPRRHRPSPRASRLSDGSKIDHDRRSPWTRAATDSAARGRSIRCREPPARCPACRPFPPSRAPSPTAERSASTRRARARRSRLRLRRRRPRPDPALRVEGCAAFHATRMARASSPSSRSLPTSRRERSPSSIERAGGRITRQITVADSRLRARADLPRFGAPCPRPPGRGHRPRRPRLRAIARRRDSRAALERGVDASRRRSRSSGYGVERLLLSGEGLHPRRLRRRGRGARGLFGVDTRRRRADGSARLATQRAWISPRERAPRSTPPRRGSSPKRATTPLTGRTVILDHGQGVHSRVLPPRHPARPQG